MAVYLVVRLVLWGVQRAAWWVESWVASRAASSVDVWVVECADATVEPRVVSRVVS